MLIIDQTWHSANRAIEKILSERDTQAVVDLVHRQYEAGADALNLNCGSFGKDEFRTLTWLVKTIRRALEAPKYAHRAIKLVLDTREPQVFGFDDPIDASPFILNGITLEQLSLRRAGLFLGRHHELDVIALCADDHGIPQDVNQVVELTERLVARLEELGVGQDRIFVDPLVRPAYSDPCHGRLFLSCVVAIKDRWPDLRVIGGMGMISTGLPDPGLLESAYIAASKAVGVDAMICDVLKPEVLGTLEALDVIFGRDPYGVRYQSARQNLSANHELGA